MKTILVTGAAGFVGSHLCNYLTNNANNLVIGFDNVNDYYDITLKESRIDINKNKENFIFINGDITNKEEVESLFNKYNIDIVVNLAGYAGVRNSMLYPAKYIESNIFGFNNIIDMSNKYNVKHFIYASSSSVYGDSKSVPYKEDSDTDKPISLYAATKKCDEIIAHSYSNMYNLYTTGLRFFTVYGPYGRPDMAYFSFTNKLINNEEIEVYNYGNLKRDFTYIDDVVKAISLVIDSKPKEIYNIYNIGKGNPNTLIEFINILKKELINNKLVKEDINFDKLIKFVEMNKADVYETHADTSKFEGDFNFKPSISLEEGIDKFILWYKGYYKK